jgi:outer membrane receptor protein involved in Fe transport
MLIRENGKPQNTNIDKIENYGFEISTDYRISSHWKLNANYSFLQMKHPVIAAPKHKAYIGAHAHYGPFSAISGIQYIDGLYTSVGDNENTNNFILWNLTTNYQINSSITIFAKGDNLLAQRYEINNGYPMPKATFTGGIKFEW